MDTKAQLAWAGWIGTYESTASEYINMKNAFLAGYASCRAEENSPCPEANIGKCQCARGVTTPQACIDRLRDAGKHTNP